MAPPLGLGRSRTARQRAAWRRTLRWLRNAVARFQETQLTAAVVNLTREDEAVLAGQEGNAGLC